MGYLYGTEYLESRIFGESREDKALEPLPELELSLDDKNTITCRIAAVFMEGEKEYIALEAEEETIYLMRLSQGENDGIKLEPLEDKQEQEAAMAAFLGLAEDETDMEESGYDGNGSGRDKTESIKPGKMQKENL